MAYKKTGQFTATKQTLQKIVSLYGYSEFSFTVPDSGIENSTFIIKSTVTFVLRIYRLAKKNDSDILREIDFMQTLRCNDILVPRILRNTSQEHLTKVIIDGKEWSAIAMEYVSGHHPSEYKLRVIDQLASSQAAMHQLGIKYASEVGGKPQLKLQPGEFTDHIDDSTLKNDHIKALIHRVRGYSVLLDKDLAYGYVHNDFDIENTLFDSKDNLVSILDFDDLVVAPVVVCLAFSLWSVLFETTNMRSVRNYLATYTQTRKISALEQLYIPRILLFRHYAISSLLVLNGEMDDKHLKICEEIESELLKLVHDKNVIA